jgi:hypothetical protein
MLQATDPRDYVFARLGHFSARSALTGLPIMEADYQKSTLEIFHQVALRLLGEASSLEVLNYVQHHIYDGS